MTTVGANIFKNSMGSCCFYGIPQGREKTYKQLRPRRVAFQPQKGILVVQVAHDLCADRDPREKLEDNRKALR